MSNRSILVKNWVGSGFRTNCRSKVGPTHQKRCISTKTCWIVNLITLICRQDDPLPICSVNGSIRPVLSWGPSPGPTVGPTGGPTYKCFCSFAGARPIINLSVQMRSRGTCYQSVTKSNQSNTYWCWSRLGSELVRL